MLQVPNRCLMGCAATFMLLLMVAATPANDTQLLLRRFQEEAPREWRRMDQEFRDRGHSAHTVITLDNEPHEEFKYSFKAKGGSRRFFTERKTADGWRGEVFLLTESQFISLFRRGLDQPWLVSEIGPREAPSSYAKIELDHGSNAHVISRKVRIDDLGELSVRPTFRIVEIRQIADADKTLIEMVFADVVDTTGDPRKRNILVSGTVVLDPRHCWRVVRGQCVGHASDGVASSVFQNEYANVGSQNEGIVRNHIVTQLTTPSGRVRVVDWDCRLTWDPIGDVPKAEEFTLAWFHGPGAAATLVGSKSASSMIWLLAAATASVFLWVVYRSRRTTPQST